jgi:hypothetical protein
MHNILHTALLTSALVLIASPAQAFDKDFEINDINLNEENFLDIKAHRFRKSLDYAWYDSNSAWRISSASLDQDLAFVQTELKLQQELSEYVNIRLDMAEEIFYADKELPLPSTEVEIYPWAGDIGFSVLGTPTYDKRDLDLGMALIWGRRPWNYTRFEYVDTDMLYNQKNVSDNTYYNNNPRTMKLEGAYRFDEHYKLRFHLKHETPLERVDPDNNGLFNYEANDYFLLFDYQPSLDSVIGITLNGFTLDKSRSETGQNQQQATDYISVDVYWVRGMGKKYEIRLGTQYDHITNDIRDLITSSNDLDYYMKTLQLYTTAYHPFNEHMAWDLGFYIGQAKEEQIFLQDPGRDTLNDDVQAKFRMGFEYSSADGRSALQFNVSLNVDALFSDPGDGGGISFQTVF